MFKNVLDKILGRNKKIMGIMSTIYSQKVQKKRKCDKMLTIGESR